MAGSLARLVGRSPDYAEVNGVLAQAGRNVDRATALLSELMRAWPDGREKRGELVDLAHENDAVTHDTYVDPMVVIRWKDIYERVEEGIDACDRVAQALRGIAVKRT